jgi:nucleoside-diphosphate-sugar epimerase
MNGSILVTGATGVLGSELLEVLERAGWQHVTGVGRRCLLGSSKTVSWDIGRGEPPAQLRCEWDVVVNAAADTRWTMSPENAYQANVATVEALRPLVGSETHVVHISTAYAGGLKNDVASADLRDYRNTYEWSKAHAERLVRESFPGATIVRPTLIVGRRADGRAARFSGIYALLRGIVAGTIPAIVSTPSSHLDFVPVDDLARVIAEVAAGREGRGDEPVTVAGGDAAPPVREAVAMMIDALNSWRSERGCQAIEAPRVMSPDSWQRFFRPFAEEYLSRRQRHIVDLLGNYEPYLQIEDPLLPTHQIRDVKSCLAPSVRYWADANSRVACLHARPWSMAEEIAAGAK